MDKIIFSPFDNYTNLRIPGITVTKKHTVLLYCEARRTKSDWANIDIVLFRKEPDRIGFSTSVPVKGNGNTVNNPVIVEDATGTLHLFYCINYGLTKKGGIYRTSSNDEGLTWSKPYCISEFFDELQHNAFAIGPGHGVCAKNGTVYLPFWYVSKSSHRKLTSHHPGKLRIMYSSDNCKTFSFTDEILPERKADLNETGIALTDSGIFLNIRSGIFRCRFFAAGNTSDNAFTTAHIRQDIKDPICFSGICSQENTLYMSNCDNSTCRENLVVRRSEDGGKKWTPLFTVEEGSAGYSDINIDGNKILIFYEKDTKLILCTESVKPCRLQED